MKGLWGLRSSFIIEGCKPFLPALHIGGCCSRMSLDHQPLFSRPNARPSRPSLLAGLRSRSCLQLGALAAVVLLLLRQTYVSPSSASRLLDHPLPQKKLTWALQSLLETFPSSMRPRHGDPAPASDKLSGMYHRLQLQCSDPLWCSIPVPETSHFNFDPIDTSDLENKIRWEQAKIDAALGKPLLLERVLRSFPSPFDFLDGDTAFRRMHQKMDMFIDKTNWFNYLVDPQYRQVPASNVPLPYDFHGGKRAPIVSVGYTGFDKNHQALYFDGAVLKCSPSLK